MILDKSDRRKSDIELKIEIDELKRMRNKDETEIKLLKVEQMKLQQAFKKFKEMGGFKNANTNIISLPDRYINSIQRKRGMTVDDQDDLDDGTGIIDTQQLLDDMNYVKNQIQCETLVVKGSSKEPNFFSQRNF